MQQPPALDAAGDRAGDRQDELVVQLSSTFVDACAAMHQFAWHGVLLADHECWYCPLCNAYRELPPTRV